MTRIVGTIITDKTSGKVNHSNCRPQIYHASHFFCHVLSLIYIHQLYILIFPLHSLLFLSLFLVFIFLLLKELQNCILCINRVWSLFSSVWVNISLYFLPILLIKLGFRLSVFCFSSVLFSLVSSFQFFGSIF